MRAPRVLMIVAKFFPAVGGTENQALLLCAELLRQGVDVAVLTRSSERHIFYQVCFGSSPIAGTTTSSIVISCMAFTVWLRCS
jgi:hypothetical protein